jgi:hypothetical protein
MSNDNSLQPEFGPNGAVLNAPTMTPEMRARLEEAARPPTKSELGRGLIEVASPVLFVAFLMISTKGVSDLLTSSSWWAGAFTGATTVLIFLQIRRAAKFNLKRWELNANQRGHRVLDLPEWSRWLFVIADTVTMSVFVVGLAFLVLDANPDAPLVWLWMVLAAGLVALSGLAFRWYADKRGWTWRIKRA